MNPPRKVISVPLEVQEDVIKNIQQVFPHPVNKELIRTVLSNEDWDLEKGLNFLHESLMTFSKGNSPMDTFDWNQKNKPENVVKDDKVNKSASPVRTSGKPESFRRSPEIKNKSKKPNGLVEIGDWVVVNSPESSNKSQSTEENNESSRKNMLKKRMIQNYDIIKLIGDTTLRISAYVKEGIKVIILLRGCSGSGKSTYAKQFLEKEGAVNVESHIFSTDNFFVNSNGFYNFDQGRLQEAHEWNQRLVRLAAQEGRSPIFVDNTNTRLWEMKEYALIAIQFGYVLETLEPPTPWFFNEEVLYRKSRHSIPRDKIRNMLDRYEANISGEDVLKRFQLCYTYPYVPPQGTSAGLNTPMSKNHLKRLKATPIKQTVDVPQITTASNGTTIFKYKEITTENKTTTDFFNSSLKTFEELSLDDSSNQTNRLESLTEANKKIESSCSKIEPEENKSSSEQEKIILQSNSDNNLEYILVNENNDILFQKDHVIMQNVKTLEEFRKVSKVKPPSFMNFDEFLARCSLSKEQASGLCASDEPVANSSHVSVKEQVLYSSNDRSKNVLIQKSSIDSSTTTADIDFEILEKVGNGYPFLGRKILTGRPDFVSVNRPYSSRSSSLVITDDKSTMIPDVLLPDLNAGASAPVARNELVSTLQPLFPQVSLEKLNELFGQSSWEDLDWAVGLLLDTGEEMYQSNEKDVNIEIETIKDKIDKANPTDTINCSFGNEIAGNLCDVLIPSTSSAPQRKVNNTTTVNEKRNFIGDWDYKNEMPSELPVEKPKPQRLNCVYKPNCSTTSTNTNYMDFEILKSAIAGVKQEGVNVIIGNPNFGGFVRPLMTFPSSSVHMLDKGTMTTDVQTNQIDIGVRDSGIERLCLMFPKVCRVNLEELFDKCQRDIDWAAGLLLDSGQEMAELPTPLDTLDCTEAAEEQLKLPEVKNNEDIQSTEEKSKVQSKKKKKIRQSQSDSDIHKEIQETIQNNFFFTEGSYSSEKMKRYFKKGDSKNNSKEDTNASVIVEDEATTMEDKDSESDDVIFMLDSNFILQLQARFGGLIRSNMLAEKNVVSLPLNLARQLHSYVMDSVSQHIQEEDVFEDEDEDYARHLQEEEYKNRDAPTLLEIMDEEVALRKSQKNLNSGGSMASALSKKLLIERFPKMDPSTLSAILDDTNNSLHQASALLEAAGHFQPEPTTETRVPVDVDRLPLLSREEAIKQADAYGDVAGQLYELRKDCLRKSQKAYVTGNHSVASYYSDMAKWYMERIEKSNSLAAKAILSGYEGWTTLDLHFLHVSEALTILDLFIDEVIRVHKNATVVYVITGRGIHSIGGRSRLKPAVKNRLTKRGLKFSEQNPGMLKVHIPRNALISYKQDLEDS